MVVPCKYTCEKCGKRFTGPDHFELPIRCKKCSDRVDTILKIFKDMGIEEAELQQCHTCGSKYLKGTMCYRCYGDDRWMN